LRDALHQIFRKSILTRENADLAFPPEHFDELFRASVGHADFILNPAQERLVRELLRVQIRREHHKDIKWHFEFSSSWQRQKINTTIERRHPAIEKLICAHALPPEIVQNQDSIVRFQLERGRVEVTRTVELQLEHFGTQFPASEHARTLAKNPS